MNLDIEIDAKPVQRALAELGRQAPFAASRGINATITEAQKAMQDRLPHVFHLRRTENVFRQSVKAKFTKKTDLTGNIRIEGPQSGAIATAARVGGMILRHETGGTFTSDAPYRAGAKFIHGGFYLPAKGLRSDNANPPRGLYPANIGAQLRIGPSGAAFFASNQKGRVRKRGEGGKEKSYFVTARGIYERRHFGSGSAVRLLWAFERRITLQPRLGFFLTIQRTIDERMTDNIVREAQHALDTAF